MFETSVNAGIPDNFESRVIVVEETEKDGKTLRVFGFDDDIVEGNLPGLW